MRTIAVILILLFCMEVNAGEVRSCPNGKCGINKVVVGKKYPILIHAPKCANGKCKLKR